MRQPPLAGLFLCEVMLAVGLSAGCESELPLANTDGTPPALDQRAASPPPLAAVKSEAEIAAQFSIPDPSPSEPVRAAMRIEPQSAPAGDVVELLVYVRIARAHFVHASDPMDEVFSPIEVNVTLPKELEAQGDWLFPAPEQGRGTSLVYRNSMLLRRPLKVLPSASSQSVVVGGELRFQVCTDELCWPLSTIELSAPFSIESKPR